MQLWSVKNGITSEPVELENVRTLLVKDQRGNPIFLAIQQDEDHVFALSPADGNFHEVIEQMGITKRSR
jgi:hypothetical protein